MENSHLAIFAKIWPITLYYSTGTLVRFLSKLKKSKKCNFDPNQLKLSTQYKYMYMYQKIIIKIKNSHLAIFAKIWPITLYYSTGTLVRFLIKFKNSKKNPILIEISSNFLLDICTCICIRKCNKKEEFSPRHFCQNLANYPVL